MHNFDMFKKNKIKSVDVINIRLVLHSSYP